MPSTRGPARSGPTTRGVVFLHACPPALAPHVEWAIARVLDRPVRMAWSVQPHAVESAEQLRSDATWSGPLGTGARIAEALKAWPMLVFEVTEDSTSISDGERLSYLPGRGVRRTMVAANGDVVVAEEQLRSLMARAKDAAALRFGLDELLGSSWDAELEPYRQGAAGVPVALLHRAI